MTVSTIVRLRVQMSNKNIQQCKLYFRSVEGSLILKWQKALHLAIRQLLSSQMPPFYAIIVQGGMVGL